MRLGLVLVVVGLALTLFGFIALNGQAADAGSSPLRLATYFGPPLLALGGVRILSEARRRTM